LQAGDVIKIDSFVNSDLDIDVGNLLKFHAKPGVSKGKNAIQITSIVRKEEGK
jgi:flagellar motor switch protein FliM